MGNNEAETPLKSEKASSPAQEQTNIHAYPNWAAIQAYYGPGVTFPPPYFNSAITPSHPPHPYMWGTPQPLMPPYGAPYAAIYSHGGVYAHPMVPHRSHSQGHGSPSSPAVCEAVAATPLSIVAPTKSLSNKDQGLVKKLKGFDGHAVSISNAGSAEVSQSAECGPEGSSDGSDGNTTTRSGQKQNRTSCEGIQPTETGKDVKDDAEAIPIFGGEANVTSNRFLGVTVASAGITGKSVGTVPSCSGKAKIIAAIFPSAPDVELPAHDSLPSELLMRDERELKRERRKQSNRESARRSRLRKQVETDELALKFEQLKAENLTLRSKISQLTQDSEKLRLENSTLMEKLKNAELDQAGEKVSNNMEAKGMPIVSTENFLARVNNSLSVTKSMQQESETNENSNSGAKLHQLLESSSRADVVAAG